MTTQGVSRFARLLDAVPTAQDDAALAALFPGGPALGQKAYRRDLDAFVSWNGSTWDQIGHGSSLNVLSYGADNTGATVSRAAISAAIADLPANGGELIFPAGTYDLGSLTPADLGVMSFNGKYNVRVWAYGAKFLFTTTGFPSIPRIVHHADVDGFWWSGGTFQDLGSDITLDWKGADVFYLWGATSTAKGRIRVVDVKAIACDSLFMIGATDATNRIRNIHLEGIADSCYYGAVFQENGDDSYTRIATYNCRRSYYAYGVTGFEADVYNKDDSSANTSTACVLIWRWTRDTKCGKVRLVCEGAAGRHNNAVMIGAKVSGDTGAVLEDIELDLHLRDLTSPGSMTPLDFTCYRWSDNAVLTTTDHVYRDIRLAGDFGAFPKTGGAVTVHSAPNVETRLVVDPSATPWLFVGGGVGGNQRLNGLVVLSASDVEHRVRVGDITAQTIKIPCATYDSNPFLLRVQHWINDGGLALQNATYVEDILFCYNAGGGAVGVSQRSTVHNVNFTSGATITYTPNGENIDVTFAGAAYTGATAIVKQSVQRLSAFGYP